MANVRPNHMRINRPGRVAGSQGYNVSDMTALAKAVELVKPSGPRQWSKVREIYNEYAAGSGRQLRAGDALRTKFKSMLNHPKSIDDDDCPSYIKTAKLAQRSIEETWIVVLDDPPLDNDEVGPSAASSLFAEGSLLEPEKVIPKDSPSMDDDDDDDGKRGATSANDEGAGKRETVNTNETINLPSANSSVAPQNPSHSTNQQQPPKTSQGVQPSVPSHGALPSQQTHVVQPSRQSQAAQVTNTTQSKATQPPTQSHNASRPHTINQPQDPSNRPRNQPLLVKSLDRQPFINPSNAAQIDRSTASLTSAIKRRKTTSQGNVEEFMEEIFASNSRECDRGGQDKRCIDQLYKCLQEANKTMFQLKEEVLRLRESNDSIVNPMREINAQLEQGNAHLRHEISRLEEDKSRLNHELILMRSSKLRLEEESRKYRNQVQEQTLELERLRWKFDLMQLRLDMYQNKSHLNPSSNNNFSPVTWVTNGVTNPVHPPHE